MECILCAVYTVGPSTGRSARQSGVGSGVFRRVLRWVQADTAPDRILDSPEGGPIDFHGAWLGVGQKTSHDMLSPDSIGASQQRGNLKRTQCLHTPNTKNYIVDEIFSLICFFFSAKPPQNQTVNLSDLFVQSTELSLVAIKEVTYTH
jgi:hypothetical protein